MKLAASAVGLILLVGLSTPISHSIQAQKKKPKQPTAAETEDDVVRVSTTLVTVPVSIKDRKGKPILHLTREDFRLFEDGVEQNIAYFDPPEAQISESENAALKVQKPLTIALLFDVSDSTEFKLKQIQQAAIAFIDQLNPEDRMLILAFDKNVKVLAELTNDRGILRNAVSRTRTGRGTSLYDAVDSVVTWLSRVGGRKAIVLLTDGVDTSSAAATYDSTVRAAERLDAAIYPIQYDTYSDFADNPLRRTDALGQGGTAHMTRNGELASEAYKRATLYLRLLANKTAGQFQFADRAKSLGLSFARIAEQLRQEYALGYYPKNQTGHGLMREIKVSVAVPDLVVRARKSYSH